jgi:hypothetical protein
MRIYGGDGQPYGSWEIVQKELLWAGFTPSSADATCLSFQPQAIPVDNLPRTGGFTPKLRGTHGSA